MRMRMRSRHHPMLCCMPLTMARGAYSQLQGTDATSEEPSYTFLDALLEVGEYTALVEMIFGHEDHFGATSGHLIENKLTLHRGARHKSLTMASIAEVGPVPPGALAIPRYKVATVIGAMQDVELHELHGVFHAGRTVIAPAKPANPAASSSGASSSSSTDQPGAVSKALKKRKLAAQSRDCIARRSCWRRNAQDDDGNFYEDGVGVADWLSKY